ncbi:sigma factor G inhibitor Gin [Brassicibacter mesophilus]|uniref:sigma factor G inhibitor Gin n=1 Tax=Brassicibacter mesophilus TaxID=745119 RepID=UPI003D241B8C
MNLKICRACNEERNDGINILGIHICQQCIDSISETEIEDIKYEYYKSVIRKIWLDYIIADKV